MLKTQQEQSLMDYGSKQILAALFLFLLLVLSITSFFILKPVLEISSRTISQQMLAQLKLSETSEQGTTPSSYSKSTSLSLNQQKNYRVSSRQSKPQFSFLPFIHYLLSDLESETGRKVELVSIPTQSDFYWFKIQGESKRIGFARGLIGTRPELTILLLLIMIGGLSYTFSAMITRRLNRPLYLVERMTKALAKGDFEARLPNHDLLEIDNLFSQLNKLSLDFKNLMDQRLIFLAGISHDVRTPLTRLKLLLALHEKQLPVKYSEQSNCALNEIDALIRIYLDAGEFLVDESVASYLVKDLIEQALLEFDQGFVALIEIIGDIDTPCSVNSNALKRVLVNLLSNIEKYARPIDPGDVSIEVVSDSEQQLSITIIDSGEGIPAEHLKEVFKPFYRLKANASKAEGSGLGLAICRQICLSQGWKMTLDNKTKGGHGLITCITLARK